MRKNGKIAHWNGDKAFGFIDLAGDGKQVFVHITAFKTKRITPVVGQSVSFQLAKDKDGRLCAAKVLYAGEQQAAIKNPGNKKPGKVSGTLWIIPIYVALLFMVFSSSQFLFDILAYQLLISLATFGIYGWDKSAANNGRWRTYESTLHLCALSGGWPGAMLAQQLFRHKSKKKSFRNTFWLTVLLNMAAVFYLQTDQVRGFINMGSKRADIEWSRK